MSKNLQNSSDEAENATPLLVPIKRRSFFMYAGATAAATTLLLSGCNDDDDEPTNPAAGTVSLGSGDVGVLNYAYALEQLEAAFYAQVISNAGFNTAFPDAAERAALTAIAKHEAIHRDFFKAAIPAASAIPALTPKWGNLNFGNRTQVLDTAKTFEDLGVAAYNGAGALIQDPTYLLLAGKIVSVEARHAAFIRDLISNGSFADSTAVDANGLDKSMTVAQVLAAAQPFITETIDGANVGK